ncbi:hypothetical protein OG948_58580 (plasmid) [Embleya sp. NBC_00888]|uniref:hypothetical protein n=1 Tax=Embleya sp. NBC_00888 TaxID=2975960 RepID=UPI002F910F95|nr:hypothetical protein OG948_58580 [Embleya sp. NBC_00888]
MRRMVVVASVKGAPGATTTALALATQWPTVDGEAPTGRGRSTSTGTSASDGAGVRLLLEADPSGGDVAAWRGLSQSPGLLDLAAAVRHGSDSGDLIARWAQPLTKPGALLVPAPASAAQARAGSELLARNSFAAVRGANEAASSGVLVVDVGRLGPVETSWAGAADALVLVCKGGVDALAHVAAAIEDLKAAASWMCLAVVGPCPYPMAEIARNLGLDRVQHLPWDPDAVDALRRGAPPRRRRGRHTLPAAMEDLIREVRRHVELPAARPAAPPSAESPTHGWESHR